MLENRVPAPRAALVRIHALRRYTMWHATTSGWIMNDSVLVCIRKMSARAYASGALRQRAMLHIIHYPMCITSEYCQKPSMLRFSVVAGASLLRTSE